MPAYLRSILVTVGVALFTFLSLSAWYWTQLKQPAPEYLSLLRRAMPAVEKLIDQQQEDKAAALLDRLPFEVVVADTGHQAISSNLATGLRQRREAGDKALQQNLIQSYQVSDTGTLFFYRLPNEFFDSNLIFPLCFSLLLGMLVGLWEFLQRIHQVDQTDALLELSHLPGVSHVHEPAPEPAGLMFQLQNLERQNRNLQVALAKAKQWVPAAPDEETRALEQQVHKLEERLGEREAAFTLAQAAQKRLQDQKHELEIQLQQIKLKAETHDHDNQAYKQAQRELEEQLTRLHQDHQRLTRDFEAARARCEELEAQASQLHEAWQEISSLRTAQSEMLAREESWKKEKQRVMSLIHEKEESLKDAQARLKHARQKIHELSVAYKKQLELSQSLPEDLSDARNVLETLLNDKDQIEHENVQLQIELADRNSEVSRLRKELEVRADRLREAQKLIEELAENTRKYERELGLLSETLDDKLRDIDRFRDLHDEKAQVLEATSQERDMLRLRLDELQGEVEALREDKGRLLYEREQLEDKLNHIDVAAYEFEIDQLRSSLQLVGQQQQRRSQTVEELKTKLKDGEALYDRLKRHAEAQEREIRNLQQQLAMHRSEIALLQEKVDLQGPSGPTAFQEYQVADESYRA